jgi:hypothetical protein
LLFAVSCFLAASQEADSIAIPAANGSSLIMTSPAQEYFEGQPCYVIPYGPLELVCLRPITSKQIDQAGADDPIWEQLGLRIDPVRFANDYDEIVRTIRLFMAFECMATGVEWDLDPALLASRIYLSEIPVIIPLWREL